jgi:membrane protein
VRREQDSRPARLDLLSRLEQRAGHSERRVLGRNPERLLVRTAQRVVAVRVTGLAAEMTYFAALSLLPLITALGASLGLLERFIGPAQVDEMRRTAVDAVGVVLSDELTRDVVSPLLIELLQQERFGLALSGLAVAFWLASRVFRAAIRALDDAYGVQERRTLLEQYALSLGFALGAVLVLTALLGMVVVGPLLGVGQALADQAGAGPVFAWAWTLGRWPFVVLVGVAWLTWLYRAGPNVSNTWRSALPGAVVATVALIALTLGFRLYLGVAGPQGPEVGDGPDAVLIVGQFLGVALACLLYAWLVSITVLIGGVVNAEWERRD